MEKFTRRATHVARHLRANATQAERLLWSLLRRRALGVRFRRQHPIGPYFADFYCHAAGLVVEVDGIVHDGDAAQAWDDARDTYMRGRGLRVLRLTNEVVLGDPERALATIAAELRATFD